MTDDHQLNVLISAQGLVKTFGSTRALDGLDMEVRSGQVHGFLGPNGAGKSTAIRVLLGMLRRDAGQVTLFGQDPFAEAVALHHRLAYVPGELSLWPRLTGGETIEFLGRLHTRFRPELADELIDEFSLDPTKRVADYSKGNRQKVGLIAALAVDSELLVLDEPTSGLDPLMESAFQGRVRQARDEGRTVLLSSHILAEVDALCDWVTIIRAGRTVESASLADLRRDRTTVVDVTTQQPIPEGALSLVEALEMDGRRYRFSVANTNLEAVMAALADAGIEAMTCSAPTLADLFLRHYQDDGDAAQHGAGSDETPTPSDATHGTG